MPHISKDQPFITMINTFVVEPENQKRLVEMLVEATKTVMSKQPGFVSATIHASVDGTRAVTYAQWESQDHFEAMLENPVVHPHFEEIRAIAKPERNLYHISYVEEAP
jgi:quinol monooxygenase YgiN